MVACSNMDNSCSSPESSDKSDERKPAVRNVQSKSFKMMLTNDDSTGLKAHDIVHRASSCYA